MTPENERSPLQVAHAMRIGANEKLGRPNLKMSKLLAVANPANGQGFLQEVGSRHSLKFSPFQDIEIPNYF